MGDAGSNRRELWCGYVDDFEALKATHPGKTVTQMVTL
jgi:hypothetical protein